MKKKLKTVINAEPNIVLIFFKYYLFILLLQSIHSVFFKVLRIDKPFLYTSKRRNLGTFKKTQKVINNLTNTFLKNLKCTHKNTHKYVK